MSKETEILIFPPFNDKDHRFDNEDNPEMPKEIRDQIQLSEEQQNPAGLMPLKTSTSWQCEACGFRRNTYQEIIRDHVLTPCPETAHFVLKAI